MSMLKENFCKRMYYTLLEAQKHLYVLLTEVMMHEPGYVISEAIEETEKELAKLKQIKSWVKIIAGSKKANRSQNQ